MVGAIGGGGKERMYSQAKSLRRRKEIVTRNIQDLKNQLAALITSLEYDVIAYLLFNERYAQYAIGIMKMQIFCACQLTISMVYRKRKNTIYGASKQTKINQFLRFRRASCIDICL